MFKLEHLFKNIKPVIAVVHLPPLPGSPLYKGNFEDILNRAIRDAEILAENEVDGILVHNFGDRPFALDTETADPANISAFTIIVSEIIKTTKLPVGIHISPNRVKDAIGIASVVDAKFVRAEVWSHSSILLGGISNSVAREVLMYRKLINGTNVKIFTDVIPLYSSKSITADLSLYENAIALRFQHTDALIVNGRYVGMPPSIQDLKTVKSAADNMPVLIGSGTNPSNICDLIKYADGVIVGTSLKKDNITENPVDPKRVKKYMKRVKECR